MPPMINAEQPLEVYFTVDVEVWCDGWQDIDRKFPEAFRRYVYGPTPQGDCALPLTVRVLQDHGLVGSFFVEPLFATRFGLEPLAEVVDLLAAAGQEVQLHMHTEWVDEALEPLLPGAQRKRQYLRDFDLDEQTLLLAAGRRLLQAAGAPPVSAFRAGGFGFNRDTLTALQRNAISVDASYNASMLGPSSGVMPGVTLTDSSLIDGVLELPMTVFTDGRSQLRHAQLTACSWAEMESLLWQALRHGQRSFVILSHNFELLNVQKNRLDKLVVSRFRKLCRFLEQHSKDFKLCRTAAGPTRREGPQPEPLRSGRLLTAWRMGEQAWRRSYG